MSQQRASIAEISPDIYRVAAYHEPWRSSVNQYLIVDAAPALISTGLRGRFEDTWTAISEVVDPATLRSIIVPHFEADECGALNEFLQRAPDATALASMRAVIASLADFAVREPRGLGDGEVIVTGKHALRVIEVPYVHAWDGIVLAEEQAGVTFTADLFGQPGMSEAVTRADRSALSVQLYRTVYGVPPPGYLQRALDRIEASSPTIYAPGHGSALADNLHAYARAFRALAAETRVPSPAEPADQFRAAVTSRRAHRSGTRR